MTSEATWRAVLRRWLRIAVTTVVAGAFLAWVLTADDLNGLLGPGS